VTGDLVPEVIVSTAVDPGLRIYAQGELPALNLVGLIPAVEGAGPGDIWFRAGDVDGDALNDLVVVQDGDKPDIERVWVAFQRKGALDVARAIATLPKDGGNIAGGELLITDLNLDGRNDIVVTSEAFDMVALLATASGDFHMTQAAFPTAGSVLSWAVGVGDMNCDGCPDAIGSQVGAVVLFPGESCAH
jgi:hypothetical protein